MSDVQHKYWFIDASLPHNHVPLMHRKIVSYIEALEIEMKSKESIVREIGVGIVQIQLQLSNISIHI